MKSVRCITSLTSRSGALRMPAMRCLSTITGEDFKKDLRAGKPKMGIFVNSHSHTVASQLSHSGYDWLLVDNQHGPMDYVTLSSMLNGIALGKAKSLVRVTSYADRAGIQQSLDAGADGVLIPYVNTKEEVDQAMAACYYPTQGNRSVYFPQSATNAKGLLGYAGNFHKHILTAIQVETASCIKNIDGILSNPGLDIAFLGQNDLCMSMGLFEKYKFPDMYFSKELNEATDKMLATCKKYNKIPGLFLFGTDRVAEFLKRGFTFVAVGNDLHHVLTQAGTYVNKLEEIAKETGKSWKRQPTNLF